MTTEKKLSLDVLALLDRLDQVSPLPEHAKPRQGATLDDRGWVLDVSVIDDHEPCGFEVWKPGIAINCNDREGDFGTDGFVTFDQCRMTESQIARIHQFIDRWVQRNQFFEHRRQMRARTKASPRISEQAPLSDEELQAIQDRCHRATPGPWVACREHYALGTIGGPICYMDEDQDVVVGQPCDVGPTHDPLVDAEFIAGSRNDIPQLLKEIGRLKWELKLAQRPQVPFVSLNTTVEVSRPSQWPGKPRDWSRDSIPGHVREWMDRPAAVEQAFRRGYVQGAAQVVPMLGEGVALKSVDKWVYGPLWVWRFEDPQRCVMPPEVPSTAKFETDGGR